MIGAIASHYVAGYRAEVLADSPMLYWKLDEASGTTAADSSGNGRNGTHTSGLTVGAASLLGDGSGKAVTYPGANDRYTRIPYASWMNVTAFTTEARVKPAASDLGRADASIIWGRDGSIPNGGNRVFNVAVNSTNKFQVFAVIGGTNQSVAGSTTVTAGTIYTVAAKYDGATLALFVNGVLDGSLAVTGALAQPTSLSEFLVGNIGLVSNASAYAFGGTIDEVSWYATGLSDSRLLVRHNAAIAA